LLYSKHSDRVAQWIRRLPTEQEILGSIPSMVVDSFFRCCFGDVRVLRMGMSTHRSVSRLHLCAPEYVAFAPSRPPWRQLFGRYVAVLSKINFLFLVLENGEGAGSLADCCVAVKVDRQNMLSFDE
jgi:hypothetical protein